MWVPGPLPLNGTASLRTSSTSHLRSITPFRVDTRYTPSHLGVHPTPQPHKKKTCPGRPSHNHYENNSTPSPPIAPPSLRWRAQASLGPLALRWSWAARRPFYRPVPRRSRSVSSAAPCTAGAQQQLSSTAVSSPTKPRARTPRGGERIEHIAFTACLGYNERSIRARTTP